MRQSTSIRLRQENAARMAELKVYLDGRIEIDGDCWLWTGALSRGKDPVMNYRKFGGNMGARVAMWIATGKRKREGYKLAMPDCDCRCINPAHTKELTHQQLFSRASKRGRLASGPRQSAASLTANRSKPHVKLNPEIVAQMRARHSEHGNAAAVGREFGISHAHAHRVVTGKWWRETSPWSI